MKTLSYIAAACFIGGIILLSGCSKDDNNTTNPTPQLSAFEQLADDGDTYFTSGTKNITAADLWTEMNDADTTQPYIISIRSLADDTVHIPGAHHWEAAELISNYNELPTNKKIVVYCYTGQTASFTTSYLRMMGFDAWNLKWGFCSWTDNVDYIHAGGGWYTLARGGQTLETTPHPFTTEYTMPSFSCTAADLHGMVAERCASIIGHWKMKTAADVYSNINDGDATNDWFVVCLQSEANYNAGHIPGAYRCDIGMLGRAENLKYLPTDKPIVVYCYTNHTAAQAATYLNMLGYDAYAMRYGMNAITDNTNVLGSGIWTTLTPTYPVELGTVLGH